MIKGQPSRTALLTAVQRAHHYQTAPEPKILCDNLALALTGLPDLAAAQAYICLLYTSPSPRDATLSRMPSSA